MIGQEAEDSFGESHNFSHLCEDAKLSKLVLFLGAGVSAGHLPMWNELLDTLLGDALDATVGLDLDGPDYAAFNTAIQESNALSVYEKATIIKKLLGPQYLARLRSSLYPRGSTSDEEAAARQKDSTLEAVVKLCASRRVAAVVNYNYDDLLLEALRRDGVRAAHTVCGPSQNVSKSDSLPIYHVHGFLPSRGMLPDMEDSPIVLSQDEYFHNMLEPFSWQTTTQIHFLRSFTCLFVGASLADLDMIRMLSHAKSYSNQCTIYAIMPRVALLEKYGKDWNGPRHIGSLLCSFRSLVLDDAGVRLIMPGDDFKSIPPCVKRLKDVLDRVEQRGTGQKPESSKSGHGQEEMD